MLVYRLFLSFLFINKCLPVNKLAQITPKLTHPVVLQLSVYFVMTFWLGSQVRLDMEIPGDCKLFVWKSVNFTCRKKQKIKKNKNKSNDLEDFTQRLHISLVI